MSAANLRGRMVLVLFLLSLSLFLPPCRSLAPAQVEEGTHESDLAPFALDQREEAWIEKHPVLKVAGPRAFPPFHFFDGQGAVKGMAFDYLSLIADQIGVKMEVEKDLPWGQVLKKIKEGEIDIIACAAKTTERETYLLFSRPYLSFPLVIISRKDSPFIGGPSDLRGMKVAMVADNFVGDWLKSEASGATPHFVGSPLEALKAVSMGQADAEIDNLATATYLIEKHGLANLKVAAPTAYENYNLYMAVRKDAPELASIINKALHALTPEQHAVIRNNWLSVRYEFGIRKADVWKWGLMVFGAVCLALTTFFLWNRRLQREIADRKRVADTLRESEERYRTIFNHSPLGVMHFDSMGVIRDFNDRFAQIIGAPREKTLDFNMLEQLQDPAMLKAVQDAIEGRPGHYEGSYLSVTGNKLTPMRAIYQRITTEDGTLLGGVGLFEDITERVRAEEERRNLEERLQRAEKMEALGTLAGGVAHDLNNVLGIVVGYSELVLAHLGESDPAARSLAMEALKGGHRAAAIVQDLLTLARRGVRSSKVLNLNQVVSECLSSPEFDKIMQHHPGVRFESDLDSALLNISGSSVHLEKSLINLVSNAAESMPAGGTLTIRTFNTYLDRPVSGYDDVKEGDYVVLSVADSGEGIPPADVKRIFEPFYTKKVMGRSGTGLGLAVVWGTVKDHQGYINVESEIGKGSFFTLYFPVTREELPRQETAADISEFMGGGELILVVDDVKEQRNLAATMLKRLNYRVVAVAGGEEAVEYLKERNVDLVVLDMIMDPGMDGLDTYQKIIEIHPRQKAIIVSGFSETERVVRAQKLGAGAYVRKPYVLEALGKAVQNELGR